MRKGIAPDKADPQHWFCRICTSHLSDGRDATLGSFLLSHMAGSFSPKKVFLAYLCFRKKEMDGVGVRIQTSLKSEYIGKERPTHSCQPKILLQ
jgi:hypothetical protein